MTSRSPLALVFVAVVLLASCAGTRSKSVPAAPAAWGNMNVQSALVPYGKYGRWKVRSMYPRYITIHSTQNFSSSGDARAHARSLQMGALRAPNNSTGYLTWHFTVDQNSIFQTLPTNEQGQHADYEGNGNKRSIGIEMCENRGNSRATTLDRTAKLTALLMKQYNIPIENVVPHQHWRMIRYRDGLDLGHKNCPYFLLDRGKPGAKWKAFQDQIMVYRRQL